VRVNVKYVKKETMKSTVVTHSVVKHVIISNHCFLLRFSLILSNHLCLSSPGDHVVLSSPKIIKCGVLLKARTVEPEKQPLLASGSEATVVSKQRPRNR
jgi:hypothetical protein